MDVTSKGLAERQAKYHQRLGSLAYERLNHTRQIEAIDRDMAAIEGAIQANNLTKSDVNTDIAVAQAKEKQTVAE